MTSSLLLHLWFYKNKENKQNELLFHVFITCNSLINLQNQNNKANFIWTTIKLLFEIDKSQIIFGGKIKTLMLLLLYLISFSSQILLKREISKSGKIHSQAEAQLLSSFLSFSSLLPLPERPTCGLLTLAFHLFFISTHPFAPVRSDAGAHAPFPSPLATAPLLYKAGTGASPPIQKKP